MDAAAAADRWATTWQRGWQEQDVESIVALYADDAVFVSEPFRAARHGREGVRDYVTDAFGEESDVRAWFGEPVVADRRAAVQWWAALTETGRDITLAGVSLLRFGADGLVVEQRDAWNQADGRREPPPGSGR